MAFAKALSLPFVPAVAKGITIFPVKSQSLLIESKLSRKTFYRNFDDKEDLLYAYLDCLIAEYSKDLQINNDYKFSSMLMVISNFIISNCHTLKLFWDNNLEYMILKKLNESILAYHNSISSNASRMEDYVKNIDVYDLAHLCSHFEE